MIVYLNARLTRAFIPIPSSSSRPSMCILIYIGIPILFPFFYVGLLFRSRPRDLAQSLCQLGFVSSWSINPFIVYSILINNLTKLACPNLKMKLALLTFLATESILYNQSGEKCSRLSAKPNTSKRNNHRRERCSTTSCRPQIDPRGNNDHHMGT